MVAVAPLGVAAEACSSSTTEPGGPPNGPPTMTGSTTARPPSDGGKNDGHVGSDGAIADGGDASRADASDSASASPCGNAQASGAIIQEVEVAGPMPEAGGGPLPPGMYVLDALQVYGSGSGGFSGLLEQKTLVVGLGTYSYNEAVGTAPADASTIPVLAPAALSGGSVQVVGGTTLDLTQVCPSATTRTYPFTSQNGQLSLFKGEHIEFFQMME
jgi:hypothetical protein